MQIFRVLEMDGTEVGYLRAARDDIQFKGAALPQKGLLLWLWKRGDPPYHAEAFETDATDDVLSELAAGQLDWYCDPPLRVEPLISVQSVEQAYELTGWPRDRGEFIRVPPR